MVAMQAQILLGESFPARLWPLETMEYSRYGSNMDEIALGGSGRMGRLCSIISMASQI